MNNIVLHQIHKYGGDLAHNYDVRNGDYSTGVQIVSCTLSSDLVLSESTGLFNPVLSVSANEISFDKKLANQSVSFNWCWAWKNIIPPSTWWLQQAFLKA